MAGPTTMNATTENVEHLNVPDGLTDKKGRRFSKQDGQFYDESGQTFSGYDPAGRRISVVDDVFGEIVEGGPNYRDVSFSLTDNANTFTDLYARCRGWARRCS